MPTFNSELLNSYLLLNIRFNCENFQLCDQSERLKTFQKLKTTLQGLPIDLPEELSKTGFYYNQSTSKVKCFHCGNNLELSDGIQQTDNILDFHLNDCKHAQMMKLRRNELNEQTISELFHEAQTTIEEIMNRCHKNYTPFRVAKSLGHQKDAIVYSMGKMYFKYEGLSSVSASSLIKVIIDTLINESPTIIHQEYQRLKAVKRAIHRHSIPYLKEQNLSLIVKRLCKICESKDGDILVQPCQHISVCLNCWNCSQPDCCPYCQEPVRSHVSLNKVSCYLPQPESSDNENKLELNISDLLI